jgi:hypothetical protein
MRDLANNVDFKMAIAPAAALVNANTAFVTSILDMRDASAVALLIQLGAITDADATLTVTGAESDASNMAGSNAIAAADLTGTLVLAGANFANDNACRKIGYVGARRYIQFTITPALNDAGSIFLSATWVLSRLNRAPSANPPV